MRTTRVLAIAIGGLLLFGATPGWAQQAPPAKPEKPAVEKATSAKAAAKSQRLTGSVKSASEEGLVLEVVRKDRSTKEYTFTVDPKAKLSRGGKAIIVKDLKPGDSVTVSFKEADGKLVANAVSVRAKKGG